MEILHLEPGEWTERARALHEDGWWLMSLCGVDRLHLVNGSDTSQWYQPNSEATIQAPTDEVPGKSPAPRFEIVAHLIHHERKDRLRVHVAAEGDPPSVPSIIGFWPGAIFMEREAYDMFGIDFAGHPNLTRILMPDEWEGHPLRKDYGVGKVVVEFAPQPFLQIDFPGQGTSSEEADREVDRLGQAGPPQRSGKP